MADTDFGAGFDFAVALKIPVTVPVKPCPYTVLIINCNIIWRHADATVIATIVKFKNSGYGDDPPLSPFCAQVSPYSGFKCPIKSLSYGRVLVTFECKVVNAVSCHITGKLTIKNLFSFVRLKPFRFAGIFGCQNLRERVTNRFPICVFYGDGTNIF